MAGTTQVGDNQVAQPAHATQTPDASSKLSQEGNDLGMHGFVGGAERIGIVTGNGIMHAPGAFLEDVKDTFTDPNKAIGALETVGTSAALGAALKVVLPEAGPVGKVAGALMGGYFLYTGGKDLVSSWGEGLNAKTQGQLDAAGTHFGDTLGNTGLSVLEGYGGYKLGAGVADRVLVNEKFDGFSEAKQNAWNKMTDIGKTHMPDSVANFLGIDKSVETAVSLGLKPHFVANADGTSTLMDSFRAKPAGSDLGAADPEAQMNASVTLNRLNSGLTKDRYIRRMSLGKADGLTDENDAYEKKFGASAESLKAVQDFAAKHNLTVDESDLRSGRVLLSGRTGDFSSAFKTEIRNYKGEDGQVHQGRVGALSMDSDLAPHVKAVMGIDERPFGTPSKKILRPVQPVGAVGPDGSAADAAGTGATGDAATANAARFNGYLATDIAKAQNIDLSNGGKGQRGTFISLGGGMDVQDNLKFYDNNGLPRPDRPLGVITVDGAKNAPDGPNGADGENSLDAIQMQSMAPKATVDMVLGPNTDQGFNDVFVRSIFPQAGEQQPSVVSSSWGSNESNQTKQAISAMSDTFKDAVIRKTQVLSASGDTGAKDGAKDNEVDYPASDPNVTGVGGLKTVLNSKGDVASNVAWNEGEDSSTGGGISKIFSLPTWQAAFNKIKNLDTGKTGRGVPDISTTADPATGFRIRVDGKEFVIGGTSDAAPFYGGMLLNINSALADKGISPVTPLNPYLYANGNDQNIFKDVTSGGNNGYMTSKGWDPVTGLGYVDGGALKDAMMKNQTTNVDAATRISRSLPRGINFNTNNSDQQPGT